MVNDEEAASDEEAGIDFGGLRTFGSGGEIADTGFGAAGLGPSCFAAGCSPPVSGGACPGA